MLFTVDSIKRLNSGQAVASVFLMNTDLKINKSINCTPSLSL